MPSAASAWVIAANTPGRSETCTSSRCSAPASGVGLVEQASAVVRGLADPASNELGVAALESRLELLETLPVLAEHLGERCSVLEEECPTQIAGFAPATRVMSRSEPAAAASGSWPSDTRDPGLVEQLIGKRMR